MKEEVKKYLEKAEYTLGAAKKLLDSGYFSDACFNYSAQALLRDADINVKKHSAVVAKFGEHFVKTGKVDSKYHRYFIDAKEKRETVDYDVFSLVDEETAKEKIYWAEEFLAEI